MVLSPLDHSYYPRHLHTNTGQIKASRGRCLFLKHGPRTKWFYLRIKKKEGDKRIYNPNEVCPRYSPLKIEVYKSLLMVQSAILVKNWKWKKWEEFKSTPFCPPSHFWPDLKKASQLALVPELDTHTHLTHVPFLTSKQELRSRVSSQMCDSRSKSTSWHHLEQRVSQNWSLISIILYPPTLLPCLINDVPIFKW